MQPLVSLFSLVLQFHSVYVETNQERVWIRVFVLKLRGDTFVPFRYLTQHCIKSIIITVQIKLNKQNTFPYTKHIQTPFSLQRTQSHRALSNWKLKHESTGEKISGPLEIPVDTLGRESPGGKRQADNGRKDVGIEWQHHQMDGAIPLGGNVSATLNIVRRRTVKLIL